MNGRLQDPLLGVMLTPDPLLGILGNSQSLGRYAYVTNNPASLSDPGGFLFGRVGKFFKRAIRGFGSLAPTHGAQLRAGDRCRGSRVLHGGSGERGLYGGDTHREPGRGQYPRRHGRRCGCRRRLYGRDPGVAVGAAGGAACSAGWVRPRAIPGTLSACLLSGAVGGALAEAGGGEFRQGFMFAGGAAGFAWGYQEIVNYGATWGSGGAAQGKNRYTMPRSGANNFGGAARTIDPNSFWSEGGNLSRFMNRIPGMNAIAGLHDVFQVRLDQFGGSRFGSILRTGLNIPGMPVAAALTYPALLQGVPAVMMATDED